MTLQAYSWETGLIEKAIGVAHTANQHATRRLHTIEEALALGIEPNILHNAYEYCKQVTQEHSRTFYLASEQLPPEKRLAARALYAFCRTSDDLVDRGGRHVSISEARASLEAWKRLALTAHPVTANSAQLHQYLVTLAWADTRQRFTVPDLYAEQLIDGVAADLERVRYQTFDQLAAYSYCVASTVGLMSMHIIGFHASEAIPYAVRLGVALQLTNILRDVSEDWRHGRLYLPLDELAAYGLSETDIAASVVDHRWRAFMRFQIERTRRLYAEAFPGIKMLHQDGRFAIAAAARLYEAILDDIETHDYDVFTRRANVSTWGKLHRLPQIWREVR